MSSLSIHPSAFVRPSPAADALGGVARMTRETMILCEAAGFDVVIIETVGVGQSETEVQGMVDTFLLLMLAGAGDELQGIKRGIMEMADVIAVTKADGDNKNRANEARASISSAIHLFAANAENWTVPVITCSSQNGDNIDGLLAKLQTHHHHLLSTNALNERRKKQDIYWFRQSLDNQILQRFYQNKTIQAKILEMEEQIANKELSPFTASLNVLKMIYNLV
jgi:LAO/AO transport system kinase